MAPIASRSSSVSASTVITTSSPSSAMARFRAADLPPCGRRSQPSVGWRRLGGPSVPTSGAGSAKRPVRSRTVPSPEPSSATRMRSGGSDWARRASSVAASTTSSSCAATTTARPGRPAAAPAAPSMPRARAAPAAPRGAAASSRTRRGGAPCRRRCRGGPPPRTTARPAGTRGRAAPATAASARRGSASPARRRRGAWRSGARCAAAPPPWRPRGGGMARGGKRRRWTWTELDQGSTAADRRETPQQGA